VTRYRNLLGFLALSVLWGSAFVAIKAGLEFFPPVLFAAIRYDIAGVLMLAYVAAVSEQPRPRGRRQWAAVAVGSVLLIGAYHAFLFVGEQHTTSAAAAVVVSLSPVLTAGVAQGILPDASISRLGLLGMGLGLLGVVVLASPDPAHLLRPNVVGIGFVFTAALAFAVGSVLTESLDAGLPVETMQAWSMVGGALLMHVVSRGLLGESMGAIDWTPTAVLALGYLAIAASAVGFLLYFDLLERLGSVEINLVSYVAPIVAAIVGAAFLGERADVSTALGFCAIVAGFALLKRDALRTELRRWRGTHSLR
jgi:probable blue pigment (indigoidine) exporter